MRLFETKVNKIPSNLLSDRFLVPPFSVLDTKQGYWQERKRSWIGLGIQSELGRGEHLTRNLGCFNYEDEKQRVQEEKAKKMAFSGGSTSLNGSMRMAFTRTSGCTSPNGAERFGRKAEMTSIFDPVLCEIAYKWFSVKGAKVLDPFAGGSVRGLIAGMLGRSYYGVDLSTMQVQANAAQYEELSEKYSDIVKPTWINGDSNFIEDLIPDNDFDLVFSCPPYYNLEVYSDKPEDLSNKATYEEFLASYRNIISVVCSKLKQDSFAIFVVSNIRGADGMYYDFCGDTIRAFQDAGVGYYNEGIIVNVAGTLPVRTPIQFNATRKFGRQHQNFLVFYKGNQKNIKEKFGNFEENNDGSLI